MTLNNLAVLLKSQGNDAEAAESYRRALEIFEQSLTPGHRKIITCRKNYDALLRKLASRPATP
jgi:hypothetical protein